MQGYDSQSQELVKLKVDIRDAQPTKFFTCEDLKCVHKQSYISILYDVARCPCGKSTLKKEIEIDMIDDDYVAADVDNGVFTKKRASFVISDNLMMVPNVAVSIMETLNGLGIGDTAGAELRTVTIGFNEVICSVSSLSCTFSDKLNFLENGSNCGLFNFRLWTYSRARYYPGLH